MFLCEHELRLCRSTESENCLADSRLCPCRKFCTIFWKVVEKIGLFKSGMYKIKVIVQYSYVKSLTVFNAIWFCICLEVGHVSYTGLDLVGTIWTSAYPNRFGGRFCASTLHRIATDRSTSRIWFASGGRGLWAVWPWHHIWILSKFSFNSFRFTVIFHWYIDQL